MNSKHKIAPWSSMTWLMTGSVLGLCFFITCWLGPILLEEKVSFMEYGIFVILWLPLIITFLLSPRRYFISEQSIHIQRLIGDIKIPRENICTIEVFEQIEVSIRLLGSGGLFGWFGLFTLKDGVSAKTYVTRWEQVVRIEAAGKIYLLSPADPNEFCQKLKNNHA